MTGGRNVYYGLEHYGIPELTKHPWLLGVEGIQDHGSEVEVEGIQVKPSCFPPATFNVQNDWEDHNMLQHQYPKISHSENVFLKQLMENDNKLQSDTSIFGPDSRKDHPEIKRHITPPPPSHQIQGDDLISCHSITEQNMDNVGHILTNFHRSPIEYKTSGKDVVVPHPINDHGLGNSQAFSYTSHEMYHDEVDAHQNINAQNCSNTPGNQLDTITDVQRKTLHADEILYTQQNGEEAPKNDLSPITEIDMGNTILAQNMNPNDSVISDDILKGSRALSTQASQSLLEDWSNNYVIMKAPVPYRKTLLDAMELEGSLVIGKFPGFASLIEDIIIRTSKKVRARSKPEMSRENQMFLQPKFEVVEFRFIRAFFGGVLGLLQNTHLFDEKMALHIVRDYLYSECFSKLSFMSIEHIQARFQELRILKKQGRHQMMSLESPVDVFVYLLNLGKKDQYSEKALTHFLGHFCLWTRFQNVIEPIQFEEASFWCKCQKMNI